MRENAYVSFQDWLNMTVSSCGQTFENVVASFFIAGEKNPLCSYPLFSFVFSVNGHQAKP